MLREDREGVRRAREKRDWKELKPADPSQALDAHHFAERFGLFLIILLGEVLVEASQASTAGETIATGQWLALIAAMILSGSLWWLYFDAAADVNLRVLELSGGSPTIARAIFAVGHIVPAFALLMISAGVGLLLEGEPPPLAYTLPCIGLGMYLLATRVFMSARTHCRVARCACCCWWRSSRSAACTRPSAASTTSGCWRRSGCSAPRSPARSSTLLERLR